MKFRHDRVCNLSPDGKGDRLLCPFPSISSFACARGGGQSGLFPFSATSE